MPGLRDFFSFIPLDQRGVILRLLAARLWGRGIQLEHTREKRGEVRLVVVVASKPRLYIPKACRIYSVVWIIRQVSFVSVDLMPQNMPERRAPCLGKATIVHDVLLRHAIIQAPVVQD